MIGGRGSVGHPKGPSELRGDCSQLGKSARRAGVWIYKGDDGPASPASTSADILNMPAFPASTDKYWDSFSTISRDIKGSFPHARNTIIRGTYPSPARIIERVDREGNNWYRDQFNDLYLGDFIWASAMVTMRKQEERRRRFEDRDRVLESLIDWGIRDRVEPNLKDVSQERAMRHSSSMVQRLLVRIENLEAKVIKFVDVKWND